jgi:hypothetical protein
MNTIAGILQATPFCHGETRSRPRAVLAVGGLARGSLAPIIRDPKPKRGDRDSKLQSKLRIPRLRRASLRRGLSSYDLVRQLVNRIASAREMGRQ